MMDKILNVFYEVCKFIVILCGTVMVVLLTASAIYVAVQ